MTKEQIGNEHKGDIYRILFENLSDAVIFHDMSGKTIEVNKTAYERLGYTKEEFLQLNLNDIDSPEFRRLIPYRIKQLEKNGTLMFESAHVSKKGVIIPVEVNSTLINYREKKMVISISRDITEKKIQESTIKNFAQKYEKLSKEMQNILDHLPAYVFYKDKKNNILRVNEKFAKVHGLEKADLTGISCFDLYSQEMAEAYLEDDREVIRSGEPKLFIEELWELPTGDKWLSTSKIPFKNSDGEIIGIIGFSIDLTEKKVIEEELLVSQKELRIRNRVSNTLLKYNGKELYDKILDYLLQTFKCSIGYFGYINDDGDLICPTLLGETWKKCNVHNKEIVFPREKWGGIWGRSLRKCQTLISNGPFNPPEGHVTIKNVICIPMLYKNQLVGQIVLGNKKKSFSESDIDLLEKISKKIAPILNNELKREKQEKQRLQAEKKLKESESKFRTIAEQSLIGIQIIQDGEIKYINQKAADFTGNNPQNVKNWNFNKALEFIHPEDVAKVKQNYKARLSGGEKKKVSFQFRIKDNDQNIRWLESLTRSIKYESRDADLILLVDITEKKSTEERLRESEEKYRSILENINEAYYEIDLDGKFTFINTAFSEIFGYPEDLIIGKNFSIFQEISSQKRLVELFKKIYNDRKGKDSIHFQFRKKNTQYIETSAYLLYDNKDQIIGFYGLARDITERKKAEILRKKFQEELQEKVKNRTEKLNHALKKQKKYLDQIIKTSHFKSEFLASMSHELRTPLNAIIGFTDLLVEGSFGDMNHKQNEFLLDIQSSAEDLLQLINKVLDISKIESGQLTLNLKTFSIQNIVNQIKMLLKIPIKEKELTMEVNGLENSNLMNADPVKLKQILSNLLSNAIKYTIKGTIILEVKETKAQWLFKIKDTGIGIPKEEYDIVFKEFKRGESAYIKSISGTGLGLPLTKRLVNLHGGEIWFESEVGKGTTFYFIIPKREVKSGLKKV
ncbi:MAG: PAS domain S-box protein [Candidatus Lokiarchaeota archaeon]|nr:PAS domain S-box protein [Candidatus Lokiarchaeota archaeon]MBD3202450.1 PAS domain S-box protein [Candidatus Lokiarchaeota archaeon]